VKPSRGRSPAPAVIPRFEVPEPWGDSPQSHPAGHRIPSREQGDLCDASHTDGAGGCLACHPSTGGATPYAATSAAPAADQGPACGHPVLGRFRAEYPDDGLGDGSGPL
jgi:hypothetical protein